jgi:hypothetical protein
MKNAQAIERFDQLYIQDLRKELQPSDVQEYHNLTTLLEAGLRSCKLCTRSNDQGDMIEFAGHWVHVDCGAEYSQESSMDPTIQYIDESDDDYAKRMVQWDKDNGY